MSKLLKTLKLAFYDSESIYNIINRDDEKIIFINIYNQLIESPAAIIYVININIKRQTKEMLLKFKNFALKLKEYNDIEIWNKVIILFSDANYYKNSKFKLKKYNPISRNKIELNKNENENEKINYDERWITQYIYYRRKQNEELLKKREFIIQIINGYFNNLFTDDRIYKNLDYDNKKIKQLFNKIKFLWGEKISNLTSCDYRIEHIPCNNIPYEIIKDYKLIEKLDQLIIEKNWYIKLLKNIKNNNQIIRSGNCDFNYCVFS